MRCDIGNVCMHAMHLAYLHMYVSKCVCGDMCHVHMRIVIREFTNEINTVCMRTEMFMFMHAKREPCM